MRSTLVLCLLLPCFACRGQQPAPSSAPAARQETGIIGTPAPGSKFSRIRVGMGKNEVEDKTGKTTDENPQDTGNAFIFFQFGDGTTEIDAHYKGEGILTYASHAVGSTAYELIEIKVDPTERGYNN